ncbi:Leucine-rich repeat-containing protein 71 [Entophlyctis luteolus]|nr:Leucine-rich repeat-containing protein 71 [Entophlyctis luteolus]
MPAATSQLVSTTVNFSAEASSSSTLSEQYTPHVSTPADLHLDVQVSIDGQELPTDSRHLGTQLNEIAADHPTYDLPPTSSSPPPSLPLQQSASSIFVPASQSALFESSAAAPIGTPHGISSTVSLTKLGNLNSKNLDNLEVGGHSVDQYDASWPSLAKTGKYHSRYRFQPTICVESAPPPTTTTALTDQGNDEEDVAQKVEVRGWRIGVKVLDILNSAICACPTITHLVLWNCGLTENHFTSVLGATLTSNLRSLNIDQNPKIPECLYGLLLAEDSLLKALSLRTNGITDVGARALASTLRINRALTSIDLWGNLIGKDGACDLAEALRFNQSLMSLSLAKNSIGDEGVLYLCKTLSNYPLQHEDPTVRKKALSDLDRLRRELEEDSTIKKAKAKVSMSGIPLGIRGQAGAKKSEENLTKKDGAADSKNAKKAAAAAPATAVGGNKAAAGSNTKATPGGADKRTPDAGTGTTSGIGGKKGAAPAAPAAVPEKGGKDKKGGAASVPANAKGGAGKKGKIEEVKDEAEDTGEMSSANEPVFEHNGQFFLVGNRTLNNLNLRQNGITEIGAKALIDILADQELSVEVTPEGALGLFRVSLLENQLDPNSATYLQLQNTLNIKNPWIDQGDKYVKEALDE